ncbi:putative polysaccharide biosynthesis protein [Bacillus massilinigeriensis]|uniref:putative polysaccharide biosynthesis protein n=1 Tax=Bacillus mediterraneensis TaxID=1805474 RepID=UPI0008F81CEB|nr:polysaccharide biosynthesis protein [Bacillus mediterraneensis]
MKPVTESNELLKGAMILTLAALATKILSAVYRVPFQNIVGDVGFYIYQQVYPFYGALLVLSTYGFPVVVSKVYAEKQAVGDSDGALRFIGASIKIIFAFGLMLALFFYIGSDGLADGMGDHHLGLLFRVLAAACVFLPLISVMRGYYQGNGNMVPTAVSQVGEQFVRVATILVLSAYFVHNGYSLYYAGSGAVFGSVTGGAVAAMILGAFFLKKNRSMPLSGLMKKSSPREIREAAKLLAIQGLAVSVGGMLLILMQMADSFNMYNLLLSFGLTGEEAKAAKGVFDRGQPLIQLGTVVATSISLSLIPAISAAVQKQKLETVKANTKLALGTSLLVGVGAAAGLFCIIKPVNIMLFENDNGSAVLGVLCFAILFGSMIITINGILQGMGYSLFTAFVIAGGFCLKYMLNMLFIPINGTMGAAVATAGAMLAVFAVLAARLEKLMGGRLLLPSFIGRVIAAAILMGLFLRLYLYATDFFYRLADERLAAAAQSLSAVAFGGLLYLAAAAKIGALTEESLLALPFGSRLSFLFSTNKGEGRK